MIIEHIHHISTLVYIHFWLIYNTQNYHQHLGKTNHQPITLLMIQAKKERFVNKDSIYGLHTDISNLAFIFMHFPILFWRSDHSILHKKGPSWS